MDKHSIPSEKHIFIAGATGVMGRRVVPALVEAGFKVTAVGRSPKTRQFLADAGATPVGVDLFDPVAVQKTLVGQEVVINLATSIPSTSRMFLPGAWRMNDQVRRHVSANLVAAALTNGAARYIQESFAPIYPDCGDHWIDENTPVSLVKYNRTVLDAEAAATRFAQGGGAGVILRFAFFYGPDSAVTRQIVNSVRRGFAPIFGAPEAYITSLSHDDAASAVVAALDLPGGVYNVAEDEPLIRQEFVDTLARELGVRSPNFPPRWMARLAGSIGEMMKRSLRISNRKLRAASDWTPKYPSMYVGWPAVLTALGSDGLFPLVESSR